MRIKIGVAGGGMLLLGVVAVHVLLPLSLSSDLVRGYELIGTASATYVAIWTAAWVAVSLLVMRAAHKSLSRQGPNAAGRGTLIAAALAVVVLAFHFPWWIMATRIGNVRMDSDVVDPGVDGAILMVMVAAVAIAALIVLLFAASGWLVERYLHRSTTSLSSPEDLGK